MCDTESLLHTYIQDSSFCPIKLTPSHPHILTAEDAIERLLDLSPYFLKNLVHLIFSRKEFTVDESEGKRRDL